MDLGIRGRKALVAGASKGLGKATARALAAEGCHLALCARNQETLWTTGREIQDEFGVTVRTRVVDLTAPGQAAAFAGEALEDLGGVDILVTNTGGPPTGQFSDLTEDDWRRAVELTLLPAQAMARAVLPGMAAQGWGRIVNITSVAVKQPLAGLILSNSIRAAVTGWAKTLADEVGKHGITVNNVLPGWTLTERVEQLLSHLSRTQQKSREEVLASVTASIPLGRMGRPEELAALVAFLASQPAAYITGVSYVVDGGLYRGLM
jgi:3-oxoacyl-[acyl-carrier protein] reductase